MDSGFFQNSSQSLCNKGPWKPTPEKIFSCRIDQNRPFHTLEAGHVGKVGYLRFLVVVSGEEGRGRDREELEAGGKVGSRSSRFLSTTNRKKYWSCQEDWLDIRY